MSALERSVPESTHVLGGTRTPVRALLLRLFRGRQARIPPSSASRWRGPAAGGARCQQRPRPIGAHRHHRDACILQQRRACSSSHPRGTQWAPGTCPALNSRLVPHVQNHRPVRISAPWMAMAPSASARPAWAPAARALGQPKGSASPSPLSSAPPALSTLVPPSSTRTSGDPSAAAREALPARPTRRMPAPHALPTAIVLIGGLHQLTAGEPGEAGDVPGLVLGARAHVHAVDRALRTLRQQRADPRCVHWRIPVGLSQRAPPVRRLPCAAPRPLGGSTRVLPCSRLALCRHGPSWSHCAAPARPQRPTRQGACAHDRAVRPAVHHHRHAGGGATAANCSASSPPGASASRAA